VVSWLLAGGRVAALRTYEWVMSELIKFGIELGPLVVFFLTNSVYGIYTATMVFMAATLAALAASLLVLKKLPVMLLVSGVLVLAFGGLTVYLHNDIFIKLKPTIINLLFASVLLVGLATERLFVKMLLGEALHLDHAGWRKLQFRYGLFFLFLALLNEVVWRGADWYWSDVPHVGDGPHPATNFWSGFKIFGVWPLAIGFMMVQLWLIRDHMIEPPTADSRRVHGDGVE
jgi:intracellular septation protein